MLTDFMLRKLANFYEGEVATIIVNQNIEIAKSDFVISQVVENIYELTFDTPDGLSQIERVQVLDASKNVIADKRVFVPVETNVRFKALLTFKNSGGDTR